MTVIVLARATNGLVVAADGRTCIQDPVDSPPKVLDNKARKVRVHRVGDSGWVTASSGRATFRKGTTVADVLDQFWSEHTTRDEEMPSFEQIAETLRAAIRQVNLELECDCHSNKKCHDVVICFECGFDLKPGQEFVPQADCPLCHGKWKFEMICECAPDENSLPSSPDAPAWCRCKAVAEQSLTVLGVPFGPQYPHGYGNPKSAMIHPDHERQIDYYDEHQTFVVQGEPAMPLEPFFNIELESPTNRIANQCAYHEPADLVTTQDRVLDLLRAAREDAASRAVLRVLKNQDDKAPRYTPASLQFDPVPKSMPVGELADAIRAFEQQGRDIDEQVGVPGIGGVFTWVTIDESGTVTGPEPIPSL